MLTERFSEDGGDLAGSSSDFEDAHTRPDGHCLDEWEGHIQGARPKDGRFVDRCEGIAGVLHRVRSPQCVCLETCDNWAYESPKGYLPLGAAWGLRSMSAAYGAQTALITLPRDQDNGGH